MKIVDTGETIVFDEFATDSGASYGHPLARGAAAVGAAYYEDTPAFGTPPPVVEGSSSAGGGAILFDTSGVRLATPDVRQQPLITAPDGGDTSFFGGSDPDTIGFPNFFGTSAAAPHAAAVTALMLAYRPTITPDAAYEALIASAIDMDDPSTAGVDVGFDFGTGFGLIQADAALGHLAGPIFQDGFE
jgi:subtilisin family serine protease